MAIGTYSELIAAVGDYLDRTDLTSVIPNFIALAEAEINRRLAESPVPPMHKVETVSLDSEYVDAPSDMIDVDSFYLPDYWAIQATSVQNMTDLASDETYLGDDVQSLFGENGNVPRYYAQVGDQFRLFPAPASSLSANLIYWQKVPALTASNTTNWLITSHPDVYLYGCIAHAHGYVVDPQQMDRWASLFDASLEKVKTAYPDRTDKRHLRTELTSRALRGDWRY